MQCSSAMATEGSGYAPQKPQFFKVLLPQFFEKLPIPPKFIQHLPNNPQMATLESPLGKSWPVSIRGEGPCLCFASGWKEFRQAHNLLAGFFLVFCYEGSMVFTFKAFDLSACLKEYTPATVAEGILKRKIEAAVDGGFSRRKRACKDDSINNKTRDQRPSTKEYTPVAKGLSKQNIGISSRCKRASKRDSNKNNSRGRPSTRSLARVLANNRQAERAQVLKSSSRAKISPPQFEKIVRAHVIARSFLILPAQFCASNGISSRREIILRGRKNGRSWTVSLCHGVQHHHFGKGWREFSEDNDLQEGDKCIFKLVSKKLMSFKVIRQRR